MKVQKKPMAVFLDKFCDYIRPFADRTRMNIDPIAAIF
jgi:hypothetical protein